MFDTVVARPGTKPGTLRTATPLPVGEFVAAFPYASNRYSNGPVWVEHFARKLGLKVDASMSGGTNYAFGGALTGPLKSSFPYSLKDQVASFLRQAGTAAPRDALYVISGGGNDAREIHALAETGGDAEPRVAAYARNITEMVTQLHDAGARVFLVVNVPDIGKTPEIAARGPAASERASGIARAMNTALGAAIAGLPSEMAAAIRVIDLFKLLNDVATEPSRFGMLNVSSPCAREPACIADPSRAFSWDGTHPTTAGHAVLAQAALAVLPESTTSGYAGQLSIVMLVAIGVALIALGRRKKWL